MKRVFSLLLVLVMVLMLLPVTVLAVTDSEPNNTLPTAQEFEICDTVSGSITENDFDWYVFTLDASGSITLSMRSYMRFYTLSLYDFDGNRLWYTDDNQWDASAGMRSDSYSFDIEKGTYYIKISGEQYVGSFTKSTGSYSLKTDYVNANATETEENDSIAQANALPLNSSVNGQIAMNDASDFYQIALPEHGRITLDMTARNMKYYTLAIYNADGKKLWHDDDNVCGSSSNVRHDSYSLDLIEGTYFIGVTGRQYLDGFLNDTGTYTLACEFASAGTNEAEPNNTSESAVEVFLNRPRPGQIALNDQYDYFLFTLPRDMDLTINFTSYMEFYALQLYNAAGDRVWYTDNKKWNVSAASRHDLYTVSLKEGTYFIAVSGEKKAGDSYTRSTGNYVLKLNTPNPFADVPYESFYLDPVLWALENGVTSGSSETTFSPGDKCLRAHVVTFLWNAEKAPEPTAYTKSFSDVPAGAWYYKPVHWAVEHGITSGVSDTKFGAGDVCSRYQVVFFLWKAAGSPEPKTTVNPFTDVNPGHFFYKAVLWAVENGITSGTSATTFGPTAPCNRAQVVTFLYAAYN